MRILPFKKSRKKDRKVLYGVLIFLLVFGFFFVYLPYRNISAKGKVLVADARQLKQNFSQNDIDLVKADLTKVATDYATFEKAAKSVYWMSFIPYVSDFKNGVEAGHYMVHAGQESVDAIYPYADLLGFKSGEASFLEKSAENRLQTAVVTLDKVLVKIDAISEDIHEAEIRINKINPNRYPKQIGKTVIRDRLASLKDQFQGTASLFVDAKPLLKKLPDILGKDGEKTYLILFQNDKELRATGGFLTSYAVFKIKDGKITIQDSEDIYSLDNSIGSHPVAPPEILAYHKGVSQFFIRDSNLSPDLVKSIDLFNSLYNKSSQKVKYDGIFLLDSKVLVDMLTILGDTEAGGVVFSAKDDKRCDCAQVIYTLFDIVDRPVNYIKEDRKGIMGQLMYALFYKAIGFSPSQYWGKLLQMGFDNLDRKDILLYFVDKDIQQSVENLNYGGRIETYDGDYLHVNNVNFAGAKSNLFVSETIDSKATEKDGKINRTLTVDYKNPYPHSDCNLERGGLCLNATLRNWVRVYVPQGSKLVSFKGSQKTVKTYDELGKTVFEGFLTVDPLGKATIQLEYTLPERIKMKDYHLLIQKQPGVQNQTLEVSVNGRKEFSGPLIEDQEIPKK